MRFLLVRISQERVKNTKGDNLRIIEARQFRKFKLLPAKMMPCCLCRLKCNSLKKLQRHYLCTHSKGEIVKQLLKSKLLLVTPNVTGNKRRLTENLKNNSIQTYHMSEELAIFIRRNEIVLKDCKQDRQFKFPRNTNEKNAKTPKKKPKRSFQSTKPVAFKTARLNIIPLRYIQSLDEKFGDFYICQCRKPRSKARKANLTILTSDVESFSESENRKCKQCGNMYRTYNKLIEHLYIHQHLSDALAAEQGLIRLTIYACHICGMEFHSDNLLYKHFQWHQENSTSDNFVDLQVDYMYSQSWDRTFNMNHAGNSSEILFFPSQFY